MQEPRQGQNTERSYRSDFRVRRSEEQRIRSVHLIIVIVMTLTLFGMGGTGFLLGWEKWVLVLPLTGTVLSWVLHITRSFSERARLYFYMSVIWTTIIYHGVHATSFYDLAAITSIEFAMLALTNERLLLHIGFAVFWFCFFWSGFQLFTGEGVELTTLLFSRIFLYFCVVVMSYVVANHILRNRRRMLEEDDIIIEELSETQRHAEDFLVDVSHAFRTPVNVVSGISGVMALREHDTGTKEEIGHLQEAGRTLTMQLDDLLDDTELMTGRFAVFQEPYMIASVINDVLTALGLYTVERPVQVIVDVDADVPAVLLGDARRVKKILHHILDNALKFTLRGGVYVRVYAVKETYGVNLCLEVQDTGCGMDAETLSTLREGLYHTVRKKKRISEGFGLGLQIVYGIVHAMNGFVRLESAPGKGTRVHVSLPQGVAEKARCMEISGKERLTLAFYQQPGKFEVPAVREYYTRMIMNIIRAFGLRLEKASTLQELREMLHTRIYSHLFIADEEYAEDPEWFDHLARRMHVIVVARLSFVPSQGSRVTVLRKPLYAFPLVEALNAETEEAAKEALAEEAEECFDGRSVLVVDDEEMNLVVARGLLSARGLQVDTALSGAEAVEKARRGQYDAIFMDHMMPVTDGVECAHRIRNLLQSEGRTVKIAAMTANAVSGARQMFAREGFDAFLAKPIEEAELSRVLRHLFREAKAAEALMPQTSRREGGTGADVTQGQEAEDAAHRESKVSEEALVAGRLRALSAASDSRIRVSCDSACDLPSGWMEALDVRRIHHVLHTTGGTFVDGKEITGDELMYYLRDETKNAKSEVPDAVAFERFFAEQLSDAEHLIHISVAQDSSPVYGEAIQAAGQSGRVTVVDSGSMSGGAGLVVLYAACLAKDASLTAEEILARTEAFKTRIRARFVLDNTAYLVRGQRMRPVLGRWIDAFILHPAINMKDMKMKFSFVLSGHHRRAFIRKVLRRKNTIDPSLLLITHAGLTEEELLQIREEAVKRIRFKRVFCLPTSSAVAVNVGPGTFGLMFHTLQPFDAAEERVFGFLEDS